MPIYEYQCDDCGHQLEAMQKISEPKLTDCDACGKPTLRRKISAAGFRLKGGGWYETDFKSGGKKNLAGDSGGTSSSGGDSGGSSTGKGGGSSDSSGSAAAG